MKTVLIAEDDPNGREYLATVVKQCGHKVLEAEDGHTALQLARQNAPDLIISDILMPGMDGYDLVQLLRQDSRTQLTSVVFYSAVYHEHEAQSLAKACGVARVLRKPSDPEEIMKVVGELLDQPSAAAITDLTDVRSRHELLIGEKLIERSYELERVKEQLANLVDLSTRLAAAPGIHELLDLFVKDTRKLIGAKTGLLVMETTDSSAVPTYASGTPEDMPGATLGEATLEIRRRVLADKQLFAYDRAELSDIQAPFDSAVAAPVLSMGNAVAAAVFVNKFGLRSFTPEDVGVVRSVTAQLGAYYTNHVLSSKWLSGKAKAGC